MGESELFAGLHGVTSSRKTPAPILTTSTDPQRRKTIALVHETLHVAEKRIPLHLDHQHLHMLAVSLQPFVLTLAERVALKENCNSLGALSGATNDELIALIHNTIMSVKLFDSLQGAKLTAFIGRHTVPAVAKLIEEWTCQPI